MKIFIHTLLTHEGFTQADLARESRVAANTINAICNKNLNGRTLRESTKNKLIKALNKLLQTDKYSLENVSFGDDLR